ncbi:hypothetical protein ACNGUD_004454 [Salmonella enterica]|nr:hypothetical protein [Salmonella enterica]EHO0178247.1 hypothetical protein [Salmonella enterica]
MKLSDPQHLKHLIKRVNGQEKKTACPSCFSQADIDEFLALKPKRYQMTGLEYMDLVRNIFCGAGNCLWRKSSYLWSILSYLSTT